MKKTFVFGVLACLACLTGCIQLAGYAVSAIPAMAGVSGKPPGMVENLVVRQERTEVLLAPGSTVRPQGIDTIDLRMETFRHVRQKFVKAFVAEGVKVEENFPAPVLSLLIEQDREERGIRVLSTLSNKNGEMISIHQDFYGHRSDEWIARAVAEQYRKAVALEPRVPTSAVASAPPVAN